MNNYSSVINQLQAIGLSVHTLEIDGRVHRVHTENDRDKRGWYILHTWRASTGDEYIVGSYGIWQGAENNARKIELEKIEFSSEEKEAFKARMADDRRKAKMEAQATAERSAMRARSRWMKSLREAPEGVTNYLQKKLVGNHGLRYTESGSLVIPMMDTKANIHGLQFILPDGHPRKKKTGRDKEYWPKGISASGKFFLLGSPMVGGVVAIGEGYATCASVFEAAGIPVAVAFMANNLIHVAKEIKKRYRPRLVVILADDDYVQKCASCGEKTTVESPACIACAEPHKKENAGVRSASAAAMAVGGIWIKPEFSNDRELKKITDFNDLHHLEGLHVVRSQIEAAVTGADAANGFTGKVGNLAAALSTSGAGGGSMPSLMSIDDAAERFSGTYGFGGKVLFDWHDRRLVLREDVMNLLPGRSWDLLKSHAKWRVYKDTEIGFDPTESDPQIKCNLYSGWHMEPKKGSCETLLELWRYLCSSESGSEDFYWWSLKWFAYPLQHKGAKMQSALVVHGPQGTGKSMFLEVIVKIYGPYGRVLGQEALEDKFNADWAEKKLFIVGDEVLARQDMYHIKNRLKGFITGDTIRVNPKNLAAHTEKNQMNIAFLSNEKMPLVLEDDDRRHGVIWTPPKLGQDFYEDVSKEIENGGIEALYDYLMTLDLGDFKPWTKPPSTQAKRDLISLGVSSEQRFIQEWKSWEIENKNGMIVPFCPCLGSSLYKLYQYWCEKNGERKRRAQDFVGHLKKLQGWSAGESQLTYESLEVKNGKNRKMVVPSNTDLERAKKHVPLDKNSEKYLERNYDIKADWLTFCFFEFENAMSLPP